MRKAAWALVLLLFAAGAAQLVLRDRGEAPPDSTDVGKAPPAEPGHDPILKGTGDEPKEEPAEDPSDADAEREALPTYRFTGRILAPTRHPVPGAKVVARSADRVIEHASTDGEGRFTVTVTEWREGADLPWIDVTSPVGTARRVLYVPSDRRPVIELGPIVLGPTHDVTVRVTHRGAPMADAHVVVRDYHARGAAGRLTSVQTDAQGLAVIALPARDDLGVFAHAPGCGRASERIHVPRGKAQVDLELPPDRTLTVTVVHAATDDPVPDADVFVGGGGAQVIPYGRGCLPPLPPLRTDAEGRVEVSGLPAGHLRVVARTPELTMPSNGLRVEGDPVEPGADAITVKVHPYRAVRFPIQEGDAGIPPDDTELEVVRFQQLKGYDEAVSKGRVEDAHVVIEPFPPGHDWGYVQTPDGLWAKWMTKFGSDVGDAITFHPLRDVDVRITYENGAPAASEWISLSISPRGRRVPAQANKQGRLVFPACRGEHATVLWAPTAQAFGTPLARVDLLSPPGPTEIAIDRAIDIQVGVTVDGKAGLPASYRVRVPDTDLGGGLPRGRSVSTLAIQENPDASTLRFRWLRQAWKAEVHVTIECEGFPPAKAVLKKGADRVWKGIAALRSSASLHVRVLAPEDGRYYLRVERWLADHGRWQMDHRDPAIRAGRRAEDGVHRYEGLTPGRYRLKEHYTGLASEPFGLVSGGAAHEMEFDLSSMVLIVGKVVVPEGHEPAFATVRLVEDEPADGPPRDGIRVDSKGRFEHRAIRGQRLRLTVSHPALKPAMIGGTVKFEAGGTSPTLRLEAAEQLVFRVEGFDYSTPAPDPRVMSVGGGGGPVRVRLAPAGEWKPDTPVQTPLAKDGVFRLAVPRRGRWDVRVEMSGRAPHFLPEVVVEGAETDLGTLTLSVGATLTLRLHSASGQTPPYLRVAAVHQSERSYTVHGFQVTRGDPPTVVMHGLGPGRFRLKVSLPPALRGKGKVPDETIESDGKTPITIDLSLP